MPRDVVLALAKHPFSITQWSMWNVGLMESMVGGREKFFLGWGADKRHAGEVKEGGGNGRALLLHIVALMQGVLPLHRKLDFCFSKRATL